MSIVSRISNILECSSEVPNFGEVFVKVTSPWIYDLNVPYVEGIGVIVQVCFSSPVLYHHDLPPLILSLMLTCYTILFFFLKECSHFLGRDHLAIVN